MPKEYLALNEMVFEVIHIKPHSNDVVVLREGIVKAGKDKGFHFRGMLMVWGDWEKCIYDDLTLAVLSMDKIKLTYEVKAGWWSKTE